MQRWTVTSITFWGWMYRGGVKIVTRGSSHKNVCILLNDMTPHWFRAFNNRVLDERFHSYVSVTVCCSFNSGMHMLFTQQRAAMFSPFGGKSPLMLNSLFYSPAIARTSNIHKSIKTWFGVFPLFPEWLLLQLRTRPRDVSVTNPCWHITRVGGG